jgi:hypothetical protein
MTNINLNGKICTKCNKFKSFDLFHKSSKTKDGLKYQCKDCKKKEHRDHYLNNKNDYFKNNKQWKKRNPSKIKKYSRKSNLKRKEYFKNYRIKNRNKRTLYHRYLQKTNLNYKIGQRLRHRLGSAIKSQKTIKSNKTMNLLGCDMVHFKSYIEKQFKNGMTWDNYGEWHLDHIKACSTFDLSKEDQQKQCFHYTNMQPLWASENFHKWKN